MKNIKFPVRFFVLVCIIVSVNNLSFAAQQPTPNPYSSLSGYLKNMVDIVANDGYKDVISSDGYCRHVSRLAVALLYRNGTGDAARAEELLVWLVAQQNTNTSSSDYGNWPNYKNGGSYDANWREFIGVDLVLIYNFFRDEIGNSAAVRDAMYKAAIGSMRRNERLEYTNPALMSAILCEHAARRVTDLTLENYAATKITNLYNLYFNNNNAWDEFNSPTYYGVDLYALMAWSTAGKDGTRTKGQELVDHLWRDVSNWFNPNLKSMVPAFVRSYGIDMQRYNALMGIGITIALDDPNYYYFKPLTNSYNAEAGFIPGLIMMGTKAPSDIESHFKTFRGNSSVDKNIHSERYTGGDSWKRVTNTIKEDWMMGGITGQNVNQDQLVVGGIQWDNPNSGNLGWVLVPGVDPRVGVYVEGNTMTIIKGYASNGQYLDILVYCDGMSASSLGASQWNLPGMKLDVSSNLGNGSVSQIDGSTLLNYFESKEGIASCYRVRYTVSGSSKSSVQLKLTVNENSNNNPPADARQAEDANIGGGSVLESLNSGYNGSGYVNFNSSGGYVEFTGVDGGSGGSSKITLRYALGNTDRTGLLIINGNQQNLTMTSTGAWTSYTTMNVSASLNAGTTNTIRFQSNGSDFGNLDEITVSQDRSIYQAENYTSQYGTSILTTHSGYTGTGFIDYGGNGTWIEWNNISVSSSGTVGLVLRYANGSTGNRQCEVRVNGSLVGNLSFAPTGSWTSWGTQSINASLNAGNNTIRITANTSSGGPNLDKMDLSTAKSTETEMTDAAKEGEQVTGLLLVYPNPVTNLAEVVFPYDLEVSSILNLYDNTGHMIKSVSVNGSSHNLDMSGLNKGIYHMAVFGNGKIIKSTVIKE